MFKRWFNKTEEVETQEETQSSNLEDQAGWIVYSVDEDGIINMDFDFSSDKLSNEHFSEMFHQINKGDLLENALSFIKQTLEDDDRTTDLENFNDNIEILEKLRNNVILDFLIEGSEEVVVKPTDIANNILKDQHK